MTSRRLLAAAALPLLLAACEATTTAGTPPRFVVFFTEDSAALNENGEQVVIAAAAAAKSAPAAPVRVLGYAGPAGSVAFNRALSDARARQVADELVKAGVGQARIQISPRGPVPFDSSPTESRRVEIVVGG
jgi:outer membrane protein OmpA-like peptidoglycan-associated protein